MATTQMATTHGVFNALTNAQKAAPMVSMIDAELFSGIEPGINSLAGVGGCLVRVSRDASDAETNSCKRCRTTFLHLAQFVQWTTSLEDVLNSIYSIECKIHMIWS
jgi:hypothetical protein